MSLAAGDSPPDAEPKLPDWPHDLIAHGEENAAAQNREMQGWQSYLPAKPHRMETLGCHLLMSRTPER